MGSSSFLLYANWKMHKGPKEARTYIRHITQMLESTDQKRFVFFAPALTLSTLAEELVSSSFGWGAQNCYFETQGAFTGENSPMVLNEMGATHCLVGHSERRKLFFENEALVQKKVQALLQHSVCPVICVGESAEDRKKGLSFTVVEKQLSGILKELDFPDSVCIAYEPIWAIGSAQPARPEQIFDMQKYVRHLCESVEKKLCFLYGGSVNEENAKELSQIPGVDGFLVGGASLDPQKFFNLYVCIR
jgi:triosephosphate isomerase